MKKQVNEFFKTIDLDLIAKATKFQVRSSKKITPSNFLQSFFITYSNHKFSLRCWAFELSSLIKETVSFQALDKKLSIRHLPFIKEVLKRSIEFYLKKDTVPINSKLDQFGKVLVEDSTCIKLSNNLYSQFSGVSNGSGTHKAMCRVQLIINLKTNAVQDAELKTYSQNDVSYSQEILTKVQANDLVIRDLGYWKNDVFRQLIIKGVFFISRLRANTNVYKACGAKFDYIKYLKRLDKQKIKNFDIEYFIGKNADIPVRIIGHKLNKEEAKIKKQKSVLSRHKDSKFSKIAEYLFSWNIFITNVPNDKLNCLEVMKVYRLRWQIEMFFKNWKSNFKIEKLLASSVGPCARKLEIKMLLSLIYMVVIYQPAYNYYAKKILKKYSKTLSPLKFGQFAKDKLKNLKGTSEANLLKLLSKFFCYDVRKDRYNYYEHIYSPFLG